MVNIYDIYHSNTWPGAAQAAEDLGYDIFFFPGNEPNIRNLDERQHNIVYQMLHEFPVDGFIIASNDFGASNTRRDLEDFIRPFAHVPHVCIGTQLSEAPTIVVDDRAGFEHILEHMINVHKIKTFACLRGPSGHPEADIRYKTFIETLAKYNIPFDESLLYTGNFLPESGHRAIEEWIDRKHKRFEAVIVSSDLMALAAIEALEARGISVPDDVAVTGFDDISECRFIKAPLTTVAQPLSRITYEAVMKLDRMLRHEEVRERHVFPTEAVIRRSCGCFSSMIENIGKISIGLSFEEAHDYRLLARTIAKKYSKSGTELENDIETIIRVIVDSSGEGIFSQRLIKVLDGIMSRELKNAMDIHMWHDIFNNIFGYLSDHLKHISPEDISTGMQKIRVYIGEMLERSQAIFRIQSVDEYRRLYEVLEHISNALEKEKIASIINDRLHDNKIPAFLLILYNRQSLYREGEKWDVPEQSHLFAGYIDENKTVLTDTEPFPTKEVMRPEWFEHETPGTYVIQPLFFEYTHMGYMIAKMGPKNGLVYESLRAHLSSVLSSSIMFEENKKKEITAVQKREQIQSVILPMFDSIMQVSTIATNKVEAISTLVKQAEQSSGKLQTAKESVQRISAHIKGMIDLINLIDDIATKINLLSINAAIQSARAGEHGRGFAIIASEIRKLADSTAVNAKKAAETLTNVIENIHQSQTTNEDSISSFQNLKKEIIAVSGSLSEISGRMESLSDNSREIYEMIKEEE
ncbi:MAG: substrate-binding domain-containing protein [Spirochaetales bacterium]|nr:substrate-binding domain-containing protein [Spirochaetales bacterium]